MIKTMRVATRKALECRMFTGIWKAGVNQTGCQAPDPSHSRHGVVRTLAIISINLDQFLFKNVFVVKATSAFMTPCRELRHGVPSSSENKYTIIKNQIFLRRAQFSYEGSLYSRAKVNFLYGAVLLKCMLHL